VPLYFQLACALTEKLDAGTWPPGTRFATEREIAEEFDVSRTAIRRALDLLVGDGAITRIRGKGAFVNPPRHRVPVMGFLRALLERPPGLTLDVLTVREETPDAALARLLAVEPRSSSVIHVTALWLAEGQPIGLIDSSALAPSLPWLLPSAEALRSGTDPPRPADPHLGRATVEIEMTHYGRWGGPKVGAAPGDPAFKGTLMQYRSLPKLEIEEPIEVAHLVYRSDNAQLDIELEPTGRSASASRTNSPNARR
jgi:GntR family transcriptional regulator